MNNHDLSPVHQALVDERQAFLDHVAPQALAAIVGKFALLEAGQESRTRTFVSVAYDLAEQLWKERQRRRDRRAEAEEAALRA